MSIGIATLVRGAVAQAYRDFYTWLFFHQDNADVTNVDNGYHGKHRRICHSLWNVLGSC